MFPPRYGNSTDFRTLLYRGGAMDPDEPMAHKYLAKTSYCTVPVIHFNTSFGINMSFYTFKISSEIPHYHLEAHLYMALHSLTLVPL